MTERPIFVPSQVTPGVKEISINFTWHPGFAPIQKRKNVAALHTAAAAAGYAPLLETSTKSEEKLGRHLSAFNLKIHSDDLGDIPLECAFQGSKVFEGGGPYTDLYNTDVRAAKRDPRLKNSGRLIAFSFGGFRFELEPKTAFYDWLYINAIFPHREWLRRLYRYAGFTDIEFNPNKSINCQARSCALFVSFIKHDLLDTRSLAPSTFVNLLARHSPHRDAQDDSTSDHGLFTR
jgi:hypothetical protein